MRRVPLLLAAVAGLCCITSTAAAAERATVAVLGVRAGEGFTDREIATIEELLLGALQSSGRLKVTGRSDVTVLLGLEAQKQAMGCDADAACVAELAGALGVQFVISADVGRIDATRVVSLKVLEVSRAASVARLRRTLGAEGDLVAAIDAVANEAESAILRLLAERAAAGSTPIAPLKLGGIGLLVAGAGLVIASTVIALGTRADVEDLQRTPRDGAAAATLITDINGRTELATGLAIGAGIAGALGLGLTVAF